MTEYCITKPALDEHHQDQLLIYLSLSNGVSELKVGEELSLHTHSLIYVINSFFPDVKFHHDQETGILRVKGISFQRKKL